MPSTLVSARLRGIRSYSPAEEDCQTIDFMPLTLIVGSNGTGKTTIIEALKFIISGEEPPHSDCRRNFIHTPKQGIKHSDDEVYALIEIRFKNSSGQLCVAKREIGRCGATKTAPPSLSSGYKIGQSPWVFVHRQDDWNKLMPKLFGLPNQAILSHIILCHQDDNLWCMGDSSSVKLVFDKIFGCEQYKKEIKNIEDEIRLSKKTLDSSEKDIIRFGDQVKRKKLILSQMEHLDSEIKKMSLEIEKLDMEVNSFTTKKQDAAEKLKASEARAQNIKSLELRINILVDRDRSLRSSLSSLTYKRPAAPAEKRKPVPKKPAPDPIVADLDSVLGNLNKMTDVMDAMPESDDLSRLRTLNDATLVMVKDIKSKFVTAADQPPPAPSPEEADPRELFFQKLDENRAEVQKQVDDNLKELERLREQVASIKNEARDDKDAEQAKLEFNEIEQRLLQARDKRSHKTGTKSQMERELSNLKYDLTNFKNSNRDYAKSLGLMVSSKIVISDLEKLKKCFQESITSFHDQMIIRTNEVLRARWRQIYQGSDIETIELVDELITRARGQKSYNYYMAMRKNGVRMKMREKGSAGQRALAAIILRITLAELLVKDFAFIALDEPTANLDLANVQALAKSIGAYVRRRTKKGANIQWIIITHDEQFLRALDEECSPFFYRIQMDRTSGYSKIVKVSCQDAVLQVSDEVVTLAG